jgi:hypothetical protein
MDPLSILGTVTALVGACAAVSKSLNDMRSKYARAEITISAISTECTIMSAALSQVGQIIERDPAGFTSRLHTNDGLVTVPLDLALQGALDSCSVTMAVLNATVQKCSTKNAGGLLSWKSKARYIWKETK